MDDTIGRVMSRHDRLHEKVSKLLSMTGPMRVVRAQREPDKSTPRHAICEALRRAYGKESAYNVAFHVMDWTSEAGFIFALAAFPEKFTKKEIQDGVASLLAHAPDHVCAAAKLYGFQCKDIWGEKPPSEGKQRKRPKAEDYDFSHGVRGKYAKKYAAGTNVVVIDPDLAEYFPGHDSVNESLRSLLAMIKKRRQARRRVGRKIVRA